MSFAKENEMSSFTKEELKEFMIEELRIVQDIIKRMSLNSILIKSWTIILVVASLFLKSEKFQTIIAFIPILIFWYLDAHFLWLERLYRRVYDWIRINRLNTDEYLFDMDYKKFIKDEQSRVKLMLSFPLGWFYISILALALMYYYFEMLH
jgi:hypothetical protein